MQIKKNYTDLCPQVELDENGLAPGLDMQESIEINYLLSKLTRAIITMQTNKTKTEIPTTIIGNNCDSTRTEYHKEKETRGNKKEIKSSI